MNENKFVGRYKELKEFKDFLLGERPNWGGKGKGAPLLLVVGEEGMGKSSLLRQIAKEANTQKHYVMPREVDERQDFNEQIYPLIAMVKKEKRLKLGKGSDWFKAGLAVLDAAVPGVSALGNLLLEIRKEHQNAGNDENSLAWLLHSALAKLEKKIEEAQRIIIFLDPEKKSPAKLIPLLRQMNNLGVPSKVRFVIAQRPKDVIIEAVNNRELRELCAEPIFLGKMNKEESLHFMAMHDTGQKLNEKTRKVFLENYGGWPLLMELALEEIQQTEGEVNEEVIKILPSDIEDFWRKRYEEIDKRNSKTYLQTVNLLPHPYPSDDVAKSCKLEPEDEEDATASISPVWNLLKKVDYEEIFSKEVWIDCPSPKHSTSKEFVVDHLKTKHQTLYYKRLEDIIAHYKDEIGTDFGNPDLNKDALAHLLSYMIEAHLWNDVKTLLTNIEYLKRRQSPEEQYRFQKEFIDLLNSEKILDDKLVDIMENVLLSIYNQLETGKVKADWLDTFAYWINEFGVRDDTERSLKLKKVANKFDYACGDVSKELAEIYLKDRKNDLALRFAELYTWVYQRAGDYEKCVDACRYAEDICLNKVTEDAYRTLGRAEFVRMRAHALTVISREESDESKKPKIKAKVGQVYQELADIFPAGETANRWPTLNEWKVMEELLQENTDKVLNPPSESEPDETRFFRATVVSNLDDCISAMRIIQFFEEHGGSVQWMHHNKFDQDQIASEERLFVVLIGGPKAPGISVADKFYEADKEAFLRMYSGLHFEASCLKFIEKDIHFYWLGGISKVNTLMAAYEFTKDSDVVQIIKNKKGSLKIN